MAETELRAITDVIAVDHVYVAVRDFERSVRFYDAVMRLLGFRKGTSPIAGEPHAHYFNRITQYTIRPARGADGHDPYRPGLHHLCFRVAAHTDVDAIVAALRGVGVEVTVPALYPEYAPDYYATFFTDPDGIRLEVVAHRHLRSLVRDHWDELTEFEDPLRTAGLL
ncbi:MAG: bleomycin resistance protein [Deltaproteobacteria bacterium]|nr:MAG: bleomycin resistance protein [Deltaproteobacteria bacterium]